MGAVASFVEADERLGLAPAGGPRNLDAGRHRANPNARRTTRMLETGIRQLRMARSLIWGRPISSNNVQRLVGDALRTLDEFGAPGDDVQQLLDGPFADPALRKSFQLRALRRTASRAASATRFYRELFEA